MATYAAALAYRGLFGLLPFVLMTAVLALLTPALLTALAVTGTFGEGGHLAIDEKVLGVGAAAIAVALRAPVLLAMVLAVLVTALARLFLG